MTEDRIFELADKILGPGRYNRGRIVAFAKACEGEGVQAAARMMRKTEPAPAGQTTDKEQS